MQNQQLMPNQTTLQQSSNSLQTNNGGLQQSGAPSGSTDNTTILSQPLTADLRVQSAQTDPGLQTTYVPDQVGFGWLFAGLILLAAVLGYVIWKFSPPAALVVEDDTTPALPETATAASPKTPPKMAAKKPKYQKKTTRRQRTRKS